jgi:hypothetical protein
MKRLFYRYINGLWQLFKPVLEQMDKGQLITIAEQDQLANSVNTFHDQIELTGDVEVDDRIKEEIGLAAADFFSAVMSMAVSKGLLETSTGKEKKN